MNRTTVSLDPGLFRRLKQEAARRGATMQECLNAFLRLGLEASSRVGRKGTAWRLVSRPLGRVFADVADREALGRLIGRSLP